MYSPNKYAIIVAGGSGLRMGADIPKQFLELGGLPVLMHTIRKFHEAYPDILIKLVLPQAQQEYWSTLCQRYDFKLAHEVVNGGASRFQSVKNGLDSIAGQSGIVAIHDGVRPFVNSRIIRESVEVAEKTGNATAAVPLKDSIRLLENGNSKAVERTAYRIIQTPQTFQLELIKKAFETPEQSFFTDDASVFEYAGHSINLIEGSYENIKITTPEDMILGEALLSSKSKNN
jgi:2-C-methyl-D-erythritol 4-phosphate cytidylyltransferase